MSHQTQPRIFVISVMLMVSLLGGCKVGPNYTVPEASVANAWLESHNPAVSPEQTVYDRWWEVFDDPVLNHLIERSYDQNLSLRVPACGS